jgi:hypothetical protein
LGEDGMRIREATKDDIPRVLPLFTKLLLTIQKSANGRAVFTDDQQDFVLGAVEQLYFFQGHEPGRTLFLVGGNDQNAIVGFLVGGLMDMPRFYKDKMIAEIQWYYPISFESVHLVHVFDGWAKEHGASVRTGACHVNNDLAMRIYKRNGMQPIYTYLGKEL